MDMRQQRIKVRDMRLHAIGSHAWPPRVPVAIGRVAQKEGS